jgi:type I restriction enzyme, S subunit
MSGRDYETGQQLLRRLLAERTTINLKQDRADLIPAEQYDAVALPEGWAWATLNQLCPTFVDSAHRTPIYASDGFPALGPRDVVGGVLDLRKTRRVDESEFAVQTRRRLPESGDIIYSRELSYGWGVIVPPGQRVCMSQGMCLFRPSDAIDLRYFVQALNGPVGRRQAEAAATGSAHPHMSPDEQQGLDEYASTLVKTYLEETAK